MYSLIHIDQIGHKHCICVPQTGSHVKASKTPRNAA
jgi:hypothetical protein